MGSHSLRQGWPHPQGNCLTPLLPLVSPGPRLLPPSSLSRLLQADEELGVGDTHSRESGPCPGGLQCRGVGGECDGEVVGARQAWGRPPWGLTSQPRPEPPGPAGGRGTTGLTGSWGLPSEGLQGGQLGTQSGGRGSKGLGGACFWEWPLPCGFLALSGAGVMPRCSFQSLCPSRSVSGSRATPGHTGAPAAVCTWGPGSVGTHTCPQLGCLGRSSARGLLA